MKKLITTILASALSINTLVIAPINTSAAGSTFEFENGTVYDTGDNITSIVTLSGASGGKAVELKDSGDSVTISVNAEEGGMQTLSVRYSQPYDENGKYQNVIVNGQNVGQIFCAYTGEGQFKTVSISANLDAGRNTVTVEGSWGWTYIDCLTIGENAVSAGANPIISRNAPAYSGKSDSASSGNDDKYYTFWTSTSGDYLAYDLSSVPKSQRKKVLAVWYNTSTYDNIGVYVNKDSEPVDYTIEVNKAAGGSYPTSGWEVAETVTGNGYSSRQHLVDMDGYNWIRMSVTKVNGSKVTLNFDIHDVSNGISDSWIFFGDSITAGSMVNAYGTGFATFVNQLDSRYFPVQENGGIGGISSRDGKENIDKWLSTSPAKYVSIAYGTNDAWGNPNNAQSYYENTKYMIDAVLNAGKIPVLPKIPYATNSDVGSNTGYYNAMIDKLYSEYGDKLVHGPDFDEFFRNNTWGLSEDGVHPNSDGYEAMRKLWAETMYENVYKNMTVSTDTPDNNFIKGDVNGDGIFDISDLVLLQKWLLAYPDAALSNWKAGDLCEDGRLDAFDMVQMRKLLVQQDQPQEFEAVYEAENAAISGNNVVSADSAASGGKAVGSFSDDGDNLTFTIEVPTAGSYCLTLTSKGMGGDKYNEIIVDGGNIGGFDSKGDEYTETALRRVMLTAGKHTVSIKKSWGWIMVDRLKVTTDDVISNSVYNVENKLINSNADECAKELFSYLCDSYGKYTLAGQVCNDGLNGDEFKAIYEATGKYPAIVGLDMMDYCPSRVAKGARSNAVETAIDFHQHGGIATFCWHWNAPDKYMKPGDTDEGTPRWWGGFNTSNTDFDIAAVMDGRDPEGKALIDADIADIAKQLNRLRDADVPVLWRPLHEASGGWFWWGAKGPDAYKQLWYYLYDQLTNVYGCNNLIWVWNGQDPDWYPGDDYVDVIGEDIYAGERSYGAQNAKFSELLEYSGTNKIIALTENGTVFDIDNVVAANSRWAWFGTWCGDFVVRDGHYSETFTEKEIMKKTYNSEYVITLDELPWNKSF